MRHWEYSLSSNFELPSPLSLIPSWAGSFPFLLDLTLNTSSSTEPSLIALCRQPPWDFCLQASLSLLLDKSWMRADAYLRVPGPRSGPGL